MERQMKRQPHKATCTASLVATLLFIVTAQLHAGNTAPGSAYQPQDFAEAGEPVKRPSTGRFFGHDQATGEVWINDFVYILSADYRVIGSSTKLGLLSAIKYQETVAFETAPNPKQPSIPYIVEIRRK